MITIFDWILRATWQASCLAVLVLVVQHLLSNKLSARGRCLLWSVVILRLLLPPLPMVRWTLLHAPPAPVSHQYVPPAPRVEAFVSTVLPPLDRPKVPSHRIDPQRVAELRAALAHMDAPPAEITPTRVMIPAFENSKPAVPPTPATPLWPRVVVKLPWIWLIGASFLLLRMFWGVARLGWMMRKLAMLEDATILALLGSAAAEMGVRRIPRLCIADQIGGPVLIGWIRPRLLVPQRVFATFTHEDLRLMFLHELGHIRRRDVLMNWILALLAALHWFNPVLWLSIRRMRADRELACDALVLAVTRRPDAPREYGHALLRLAEWIANRGSVSASPAVAGILDDHRELQRRIVMISRFNPALGRWPMVLACVVVLLAGVALTDAAEPATSRPAAVTSTSKPSVSSRPPARVPEVDPGFANRKAQMETLEVRLDLVKKKYAAGLDATEVDVVNAEAELDRVRLEDLRARIEYASTRFGEHNATLTNLDQQLTKTYDDWIALLQRADDLRMKQYQAGLVTYDRVLEAQRVLADAKSRWKNASPQAGGDAAADALSIEDARARVAQMEVRLKQSETQYKKAQADAKRAEAINSQDETPKDEAEYYRLEVIKMQQDLDAAKRDLQKAEGAQPTWQHVLELKAKQAQAQLESDKAALERLRKLHDEGSVAQAELDQAQARLAKSEADYAQAQFNLVHGDRGPVASGLANNGDKVEFTYHFGSDAAVQDNDAQRIDQEATAKLNQPVTLKMGDEHMVLLTDMVDQLSKATKLNFILDRHALSVAGVPESARVTLNLNATASAAQLLNWGLRSMGFDCHLGYTIDHGAVFISTGDQLAQMVVTRVYNVGDLLPDEKDGDLPTLVREVVDPNSWRDNGGQLATARQFRDKLLVTQTQSNHTEIARLLILLRSKGPLGAAHSDRRPVRSAAELKEETKAHMQQMMAAVEHYNRDKGHMPVRGFEDTELLNSLGFEANQNPRMPDLRWGFRWLAPFVERLSDIKDPAHTPMICEVVPQADGSELVAYADGHVADLSADEVKAMKIPVDDTAMEDVHFGSGQAISVPRWIAPQCQRLADRYDRNRNRAIDGQSLNDADTDKAIREAIAKQVESYKTGTAAK